MKKGIAAAMFLVIYVLLTAPWIFWPLDAIVLPLLMFTLYSLLAVGLAADTTELILALLWPRRSVSRKASGAPRGKTAVLMVICDDSNAECLEALIPLADAGYNIYILDDSAVPLVVAPRLAARVTHLYRGVRTGAKAGNLNHWLDLHAARYKYALLLDSDSTISVESADALLLAGEHPDNAEVAVLQSKIEPRLDNKLILAHLLSAGTRPRMRVMERVHGALGLLLSFGHNQLLRLEPVQKIGGFDEALTSEDTVLSLQLAAAGWRIELVDTWSTDTEPDSVSVYVRRTLRWARQTVELFHQPWHRVPLRIKLLLCRHLLTYLLPIAGLLLLCMSLWAGPDEPERYWKFVSASLALKPGYELYGLTLWPVFAVFILSVALRILLARLEGVAWRIIVLTSIIGNAPVAIILLPLAGSMLASAFGFRVKFIPTNSRLVRKNEVQVGWRLARWLTTIALLTGVAWIVLNRPASLLIGLNLIWVSYLLLSPLSLLVISILNRRMIVRSHHASETSR